MESKRFISLVEFFIHIWQCRGNLSISWTQSSLQTKRSQCGKVSRCFLIHSHIITHLLNIKRIACISMCYRLQLPLQPSPCPYFIITVSLLPTDFTRLATTITPVNHHQHLHHHRHKHLPPTLTTNTVTTVWNYFPTSQYAMLIAKTTLFLSFCYTADSYRRDSS